MCEEVQEKYENCSLNSPVLGDNMSLKGKLEHWCHKAEG